MRKSLLKYSIVLAGLFIAGPAFAACVSPVEKDDLEDAQIVELYECILDKMRTGYQSKGNEWAAAYPSWKAAATQPINPGPHGNRFLQTFVNEVGYSEYVKFSDERGPMPVGTIIAKESFNVNKKKQVRRGPLFFMEKVAAGDADEFGNWKYSVVQPNGKPGKISQKFCHDCHGVFEDQDAMGYPDEDYRVSAE